MPRSQTWLTSRQLFQDKSSGRINLHVADHQSETFAANVAFVVEVGVSEIFSEGWLEVLTPDTLADLSFVSSHPGPVTPPSPRHHQQKDLADEEEEEVGGHLFYDFFAIFFSSLLFGFQAHSFLPRPPETGGATIYIVAWELRPRGPLCCEVGWGSGGWGRGRGAGEGCPLFQPAEWASVPTDLGADRGAPRSMTAMR